MSTVLLVLAGVGLMGLAFAVRWAKRWVLYREPVDPTPEPKPSPVPPPAPEPPSIGMLLLEATNKARQQHGKSPLVWNDKLGKDAKDHSDVQAKNHRMSHLFAGDGSPGKRIAEVGYRFSNMGENVAWNQETIEAVMKAWMMSPGHRWNILGNFKEFGGWGTNTGGGYYWTQVFGTPLDSEAATAAFEMENQTEGEPYESPHGGFLVAPVTLGR